MSLDNHGIKEYCCMLDRFNNPNCLFLMLSRSIAEPAETSSLNFFLYHGDVHHKKDFGLVQSNKMLGWFQVYMHWNHILGIAAPYLPCLMVCILFFAFQWHFLICGVHGMCMLMCTLQIYSFGVTCDWIQPWVSLQFLFVWFFNKHMHQILPNFCQFLTKQYAVLCVRW